jgi:hypothetical protein
LVGLDYELPSDPRVGYFGAGPIIGCNALVCLKCRSRVKHADARSTTSNYPPSTDNLIDLHTSPHPESSPLLDSRPVAARSRTYFCRCNWAVAELGIWKPVRPLDVDWACGGHPVEDE